MNPMSQFAGFASICVILLALGWGWKEAHRTEDILRSTLATPTVAPPPPQPTVPPPPQPTVPPPPRPTVWLFKSEKDVIGAEGCLAMRLGIPEVDKLVAKFADPDKEEVLRGLRSGCLLRYEIRFVTVGTPITVLSSTKHLLYVRVNEGDLRGQTGYILNQTSH